MKIRTEMIFRAICSFWDGEYSHLMLRDVTNVCKEDAFKSAIKELLELGEIEDCSNPGYARRFKIKNILDCPNFLFFDNLDNPEKLYLLEKWIEFKHSGDLTRSDTRQDYKLLQKGLSANNIVENTTIIHNKITPIPTMEAVYTENGYKLVNKRKQKLYCCNICGETNPEKFYRNSFTRCKECSRKIARSTDNPAERLYKQSKRSARDRNLEYNLDQKYIQDLLEKQNNCCAYSGVTFLHDSKDKTTYPTLDRIDNNLGYVKGNVCLCTYTVNTMKSNLTTEQFKDIITKIYENKDNF